MTDHASLLRQIRADARPYVEQALDLAETFTGFRKLATENGLDWGVIKALIKAELQDEKEGGDAKVSRIIEKADFASAYADMLGLGSNMNENNFSADASEAAGERGSRRQSASPLTQVGVATPGKAVTGWLSATLQSDSSDPGGRRVTRPAVSEAPPHDPSTGELIEDKLGAAPSGESSDMKPQRPGHDSRDGQQLPPREPEAKAIEQVTSGSHINSELFTPGWSTDPQINRERCAEAGLCADRALDGSISGDETTERIPGTTTGGRDVCPLDRSLLVTAGETAPFPSMPDFLKRSAVAA